MKIKAILAVSILAASNSVAVTPANAARVLVEYYSIVDQSFDLNGVFGPADPAGGSLDGLKAIVAYTLTYPTPNTEIFVDQDRNSIFGGPGNSKFKGLPMTATITINGITRSVGGSPGAEAYAAHIKGEDPPNGAVDVADHYVLDNHVAGNLTTLNYIGTAFDAFQTIFATPDLTAPNYYALRDEDEAYGSFQLGIWNGDANDWQEYAIGNLRPYQFQITTLPDLAAGVPEPASWAFMLAGFGMIGFTLRTWSKPIAA